MKPELHPDLDWLAFQYVACELPASECRSFEERLAEDQDAREAVARAVELTQTLVAAGDLDEIVVRSGEAPAPAVTARSTWSAPLTWMSVGAAACLALVLAVSFGPYLWPFSPPSSNEVAIRSNPKTLALARAWSSVREEHAAMEASTGSREPESVRSDGALNDVHSHTQSANENELFEEMASVPMPSWMLSAVATELDQTGVNQPVPDQPGPDQPGPSESREN